MPEVDKPYLWPKSGLVLVFLNIVLLAHSHVDSFMDNLWLLLVLQMAELSSCNRDPYSLQILKYLSSIPYRKKSADPCYKTVKQETPAHHIWSNRDRGWNKQGLINILKHRRQERQDGHIDLNSS